MDFSALMKIASENKSSAQKQQQQKHKVTNSKTNHGSGEKVSHEAVKAFLSRKEDEKKRKKAEEEIARRARIKARLEAENKTKVAKSSSSSTHQTLDNRHKDSQIQPSVTSVTSCAATSGYNHTSNTDRSERKQSERSQNSTKPKEKHRKSISKPPQDNSAEVSKKDKELVSKPEKQTSSKVVRKGQKPAPVSFKDLIKIAEQKAKEPISNTEPQKDQQLPFQAKNQSTHKQKSKNGTVTITLKGVSGSRAKTNNIQETAGKKRKSDPTGSGKVSQYETGSKLSQSSKRPKNFDSGPAPSKAGKRDTSSAVQRNINHKKSIMCVTQKRGSSIEAQFGSSLTKAKTVSVASSNKVKHSQGSKVSTVPQVSRAKRIVERNPVRRDACTAKGLGIEAQCGSGNASRPAKGSYDRPSQKRKLDYADDELDDYDDDLDDFIDDGGEEIDVSKHIKEIFGYDKSRYRDSEDDVRNMESSFSQIEKEEIKSSRIARLEDEVEFLKEQAMLKKERDKLRNSLKRK